MKGGLFLTTGAEAARALLAAWRQRHPDAHWSVFVRDDLRAPLADMLQGCEVRRDKAFGSRMAMLRGLRRERFDLLVVAWQGGERPEPLKLAAPFAGARRVVAVDERLREIEVRWWSPWAALRHGVRRLGGMKAQALVLALSRTVCAFYRASIGWLLGSIWLTIAWAGARSRKQ